MFRPIAFTIAFMLTGAPAALACLGSCAAMAMHTAADGRCEHERLAAPSSVSAASDVCATPLAPTPFLIEAQHRAPNLTGTSVPLIAAIVTSPAAASHATVLTFADSPPARSLLSHRSSPVLRI